MRENLVDIDFQPRKSISELDLPASQLKNDGFPLKWLRVRDLNVGKAKKKMQTRLEYNKAHDIANIQSTQSSRRC